MDAAQARMMDAGAREQQQEATAPESASEVLRGAAGSSAAGGASNRADPAAAKSTLRAVVDSVALADRRAAREAWKRHEEQAEQVERAAACEELAQHAARRAADHHRASHCADRDRADMERKVAQLEAEAACMYSAVYSTCMQIVYCVR